MGKRKFNKQHCCSKVRATITMGNTTITLVGQHAFEWSIVLSNDGKTIITTFHNREEAVKEFNKYK